MIAGPGFWDAEIERAGWVRVPYPSAADFPELQRRPTVWGRNCYVRGADRLVMEWTDQVWLSAVLVNGEPRRVESEDALLAVVRPGSGTGR